VSRRELLSTAAAVGLAAVTSRAGGADGPQPASDKPAAAATLRWGLIGTGTRGAFTHIPVLKEAPGSELIALCDVSEDRLRAAAPRCPKPPTTYFDTKTPLPNPDANPPTPPPPTFFPREIPRAAPRGAKQVLGKRRRGVPPADADAMQKAAESASTVI